MAVNGIYGYNSLYQNSLDLFQITSARSAANTVSAIQKIPALNSSYSTGSVGVYSSSVDSFLKNYQSELTGLESAASKLTLTSSGNVFQDYEAGSSDESVAAASSSKRLDTNIDMELEVQSTAQAQKNTSTSHYAFERVSSDADMDFDIQGSSGTSVHVSVSSTDEAGKAKGYKEMYEEAAKQINENSSLGVKAAVETKEGKVSLVLTARKSGEANGFSVSGNTGAADGLDQTSVKAQDAVYTVTKSGETKTYQSSTNKISLEAGKVDVELKSTGKTSLYTGVDEDKIVSAVKDLVDQYNSVTSLLKKNVTRGTGTAYQLASFNRGMADTKTLKSLGITYDKDGALQLDEDKLKSALETNYEGTASLIGGQFGIAERAASKADSALSSSVQSIVSNDLASSSSASWSQGQSADSVRYGFLSQFAHRGAYNMSNLYTVGMLLNTMA